MFLLILLQSTDDSSCFCTAFTIAGTAALMVIRMIFDRKLLRSKVSQNRVTFSFNCCHNVRMQNFLLTFSSHISDQYILGVTRYEPVREKCPRMPLFRSSAAAIVADGTGVTPFAGLYLLERNAIYRMERYIAFVGQ